MVDTTIVGERVDVAQISADARRSALSWAVVIAGAIAATAVTFIILSLGTGIGFAVVSPYGGNPSGTTLTVLGALWLIIAESFGFATGGYLAGRLRVRAHIPTEETRFRDAAHGFMTWAIAVAIAALVGLSGLAHTAANTAAATGSLASSVAGEPVTQNAVAYYVDALFRSEGQAPRNSAATAPAPAAATPGPAPGTPETTTAPVGTTAPAQPATAPARQTAPAADNGVRAEVGRIMINAISSGELRGEDRSYLAGLVAARTGLSQQDAEKRVAEVEARARQTVKDTAETARKAGAYLSFWTFMALLFGAVAATLGGILGGELRDEA